MRDFSGSAGAAIPPRVRPDRPAESEGAVPRTGHCDNECDGGAQRSRPVCRQAQDRPRQGRASGCLACYQALPRQVRNDHLKQGCLADLLGPTEDRPAFPTELPRHTGLTMDRIEAMSEVLKEKGFSNEAIEGEIGKLAKVADGSAN